MLALYKTNLKWSDRCANIRFPYFSLRFGIDYCSYYQLNVQSGNQQCNKKSALNVHLPLSLRASFVWAFDFLGIPSTADSLECVTCSVCCLRFLETGNFLVWLLDLRSAMVFGPGKEYNGQLHRGQYTAICIQRIFSAQCKILFRLCSMGCAIAIRHHGYKHRPVVIS